jgi:hypothetical protein
VERPKIGFAHEPRDTVLAAGLAGFTQIEEDARGTVDAVARDEGRPNQTKQSGVLLRAVRDRLVMTLTETGTSIVGSGSYAIEAGRSGALQVSGVEGQVAITLTLQYDSGMTATFSGELTDASHLAGTLAYANGFSGSMTFVRQ